MPEVVFENKEREGWVYVGRNSKGEPKFRKYTNETIEFVKEYLDARDITYFVHEDQKLIFIYKEKEPTSRYSKRYCYYYTTGRWGDDSRRKHYHSDGIEHFITKYYKTAEQERAYWDARRNEEQK